ncbi:hypothetical protein BpHYR1_040758 [Brachionus plicatilis]|uniref:Uncharacterized protein n=1 Tax=Brachionus plicatilis TaxID=10195 RepID=A0A3M7PS59_BRAPC|nr:hypothetical protein BpHYR1_040758 [Brachionus plicatilis]
MSIKDNIIIENKNKFFWLKYRNKVFKPLTVTITTLIDENFQYYLFKNREKLSGVVVATQWPKKCHWWHFKLKTHEEVASRKVVYILRNIDVELESGMSETYVCAQDALVMEIYGLEVLDKIGGTHLLNQYLLNNGSDLKQAKSVLMLKRFIFTNRNEIQLKLEDNSKNNFTSIEKLLLKLESKRKKLINSILIVFPIFVRIQKICHHFIFALYLNQTSLIKLIIISEQVGSFFGRLQQPCLTRRVHSRRNIHRIAPNVVQQPISSNDASSQRTTIKTHFHLKLKVTHRHGLEVERLEFFLHFQRKIDQVVQMRDVRILIVQL